MSAVFCKDCVFYVNLGICTKQSDGKDIVTGENDSIRDWRRNAWKQREKLPEEAEILNACGYQGRFLEPKK